MRHASTSNPTSERAADANWAAVVERDSARDGSFVYAVATTGVFCRPSCGSRRPLRRNVEFFDAPAAAAAAGYRACKRCRPSEVERSTELFDAVRRLIDASGEVAVTLDVLARKTGATPTRIQRTFKRATGLSPREYQDARRGERLRNHLRAGRSVTRATLDAGYASTSRLHHRADEMLGMTPNAFRNRGKGMHIEFGTTTTPLGELIVAYTDRGICSVAIGSDASTLEAELRSQFSAADVVAAGSYTRKQIASVVAAIKGSDAPIPLDLAGTDFQLLVWRALQRIPRGETRSYSALAESIGHPSAARAVARACAQNRVAVVIPCHRVIREDGQLGGYRWGIERKRRLLDQEAGSSKP